MTHVISVDFEAYGFNPVLNGFTQLGAALVRVEDGKEIATFGEYASQIGYEKGEKCIRTFWEQPSMAFT